MLISLAVGFTAMITSWRKRDNPGALPLAVMFFGICLWNGSYLFALQSPSIGNKILWYEIAWIGVVTIPIGWLLFAMEYTGRDRFVRPKYILPLLILPSITVALALTSESHQLLYSRTETITVQGQILLNRVPGPWFWIILGYSYLLGAFGSVPLLELVRSEADTFRGQSGAILIGTLIPWMSNILFLLGIISIPAYDPTPLAFLISGLSYLAAVTRFQLFNANPSVSRHAKRLFIDQLEQGAVVVDSNGIVVDMNSNAEEILDLDPAQVLGMRASDAIDQYDAFRRSRMDSENETIESDTTNKLYDVIHTEITNSRGRVVGSIFTLHDVSDYVRNQQRHDVLNRLFRHNIRTEISVIVNHADLLDADNSKGSPSAIKESASRIEESAEQAREIIDIFEQSREPSTPVSLSSLLEDCTKQVKTEHAQAMIVFNDVPPDVYIPSILETAYCNVIENAVVHNDKEAPEVQISVEESKEMVSVTIADNGPGIGEYERSVIQEGMENDLEHGSGLGLWLVKWAAEVVGGEVTFDSSVSAGTAITITVPKMEMALERETHTSANTPTTYE